MEYKDDMLYWRQKYYELLEEHNRLKLKYENVKRQYLAVTKTK